MHSSLLVVGLLVRFLIRPAPVLDGSMPGLVVMQFALVSAEEGKEGSVAAETLQGKNILRRNLSIWRAEA